MADFDAYNNYYLETDFYGGHHPQPPVPLPYPLPSISRFTGLTRNASREIPFIPDVPQAGQGHADHYWTQLINKVTRQRVPSPIIRPSDDWLQVCIVNKMVYQLTAWTLY